MLALTSKRGLTLEDVFVDASANLVKRSDMVFTCAKGGRKMFTSGSGVRG